MATNTKKILILGASYGGLSVAHYTLKHVLPKLPKDGASYQGILVSSSSQVFCRPACPRAMISEEMFPQEELFVDIEAQFHNRAEETFRFIQGSVTELDHRDLRVVIQLQDGTTETLDYHAVVIATGASTASPLLGLTQDEKFLKECWHSFRMALTDCKSIVIAGGGPAGIETAGELGEYLNGRAGLFSSHVAQPKATITVLTNGENILPQLRPSIAKKAEKMLAKLGVAIIKNVRVAKVLPQGAGTTADLLTSKATIFLDNGQSLDADIYIPATGTSPNTDFITEKNLLAPDGRVLTNPTTLRVDRVSPQARVYAIGDASTFSRPAIHNILAAVPVLCANLRRDLLIDDGNGASVGQDRLFHEDTRETQLVPIGRSKGVGAAMGWRIPSFLVWLIKGREYWLWTTGNLWSGKQWEKESR